MYNIKSLNIEKSEEGKGVWRFYNHELLHNISKNCGDLTNYYQLNSNNYKYVLGRDEKLDQYIQSINLSNFLYHTFSELEMLYQNFAIEGLEHYIDNLEISKSIYSFCNPFIENDYAHKNKHTVVYNLGGDKIRVKLGRSPDSCSFVLNSNEGLLLSNVINPYYLIESVEETVHNKVFILKGYLNLTNQNKPYNDTISTKINKIL